ncbi:MAG: hypothetical protein LBT23_01595 [Synergistaceae bacterium]|jgi:hypothetical protein|nr:hypothetical protein [Synergistaceae bacterium]
MRVIEFDSFVETDVIRIPERYRGSQLGAVRVIVMSGEGTPEASARDRMESVRALSGIIPDDFDLDETRLERIQGKQPGKL